MSMKRARKVRDSADDLRPEYSFDYSKAKPNPYAARLQGRTVAVVLEPDVAAAFPDSKAVNRQLRAVVATVPRRSRKRIAPRTRGGRTRS
jgi:hypothetical protein